MDENPPFLVQQEPRLSIKESEKVINELLRRLNIVLPSAPKHKQAIAKHGISPYHRKSFNLNEQIKIEF